MIAVLYGNEPYVIDARKRKLLEGVDEVFHFEGDFTSEIAETLSGFSLFAERRGVVLRMDSLKSLETKAFENYVKKELKENVLIVLPKKADARTKTYKHLLKEKILIPCNKVETKEAFQRVILQEVARTGARIKTLAMEEFVSRMNYFENDDITLLNAAEYIKVCALVTKEITRETVELYVPSFVLPDVFKLASLMEQGDASALVRTLNKLPASDAIRIMSLVLRELRIAYKYKWHLYSEEAIGVRENRMVFKNHPRKVLFKALQALTERITDIKKGRLTEGCALKLSLCEVMHLLQTGG